jgi:hypothetical protein
LGVKASLKEARRYIEARQQKRVFIVFVLVLKEAGGIDTV